MLQSLDDVSCDLLVEVLKTLYNFTLVTSPWQEKFNSLKRDLLGLAAKVQKVMCKPCLTKEKHLEVVK